MAPDAIPVLSQASLSKARKNAGWLPVKVVELFEQLGHRPAAGAGGVGVVVRLHPGQ